MESSFDFEKEYGIVLEGGGAKGAYQIGVWKALLENNVKIKGVAGVSVGALNGALITMGDYELAKKLWENITYSQIMDVEDEEMDKIMSGSLKGLSIPELTRKTTRFLLDRGFDVNPLKNLIEECIDGDKIKNSNIECILGTFSISDFKELDVTANEVELDYLKDYLLGSAYFPAFKNEKLHGKKYIDGGVINNVPVDMLLNRDYKNIIVIRIYGIGLEKRVKVPEDVTVIEIAPRVNLGNILEFNKEKSVRNMKIGYYDGLRCLRGYVGKIYYIDSWRQEDFYMKKIMSFDQEMIKESLEYYKLDFSNVNIMKRQMIESVCPAIANELKLDKNWTYQELYISMIELCAKNLRIQKYRVYLEDELLLIIKEKYKKVSEANIVFKPFIELILKLITSSGIN